MVGIFRIVVILALLSGLSAEKYETCTEEEHLEGTPECPRFEDSPTYFPYPSDCTKYFECTNGDARCFQCPKGTLWDQNIETCNHEALVECSILSANTPTTNGEIESSPVKMYARTRMLNENPAEWICEKGFNGAKLHPFDCEKFYICDAGRRPCLFSCPKGLYWSPITKNCEWPWDVPSCSGGTPTPLTTHNVIPNYRNFPRLDIQDYEVVLVKRSTEENEDPCHSYAHADVEYV